MPLVFGRSPNLILAALIAGFNVLAIFHVGGFTPDAGQTAAVNVFLAALVAAIANSDTITTAAAQAATARKNGKGTT